MNPSSQLSFVWMIRLNSHALYCVTVSCPSAVVGSSAYRAGLCASNTNPCAFAHCVTHPVFVNTPLPLEQYPLVRSHCRNATVCFLVKPRFFATSLRYTLSVASSRHKLTLLCVVVRCVVVIKSPLIQTLPFFMNSLSASRVKDNCGVLWLDPFLQTCFGMRGVTSSKYCCTVHCG